MGYEPMKDFIFVFDKFQSLSGEFKVRACTEYEATLLLKKLGLFDLVSLRSTTKIGSCKPPSTPQPDPAEIFSFANKQTHSTTVELEF